MSSRKRSRAAHDTGSDDEDVQIQSASSSFRQQSHSKRSRIAMAAERGGSVVSDDDDDNIEEDDYAGRSKDGRDVSTAQSSDEEDDDEADELRATQAVEKEVRKHKENMASDQGIIEEVYCRNFMCHSKLRIKLGPLINFIIGHNGSGKSAVLTALTMCLGGKATATNRGASLKSLIKEGEESATLAVKIKNRGDGAYKPDLYGSSITVERNFSRSGTSGFKIKNSEDKIISTKKADLDDILDFFAFQLDNPINVLTQDMARQFLANSTPSDKYKFFIRGTQLETLDADYKLMEEHLDNMQMKLESRETDIQVLKQNAEEAKQRKKRLDAARNIEEKIQRTQWMHAWAQVEEQEVILARFDGEVEEAEEVLTRRETEEETASGRFEGQDQSSERAKALVTQLQDQAQPFAEAHATAKADFDANTDQLRELKNQERMIKGNMKQDRDAIKHHESAIAVERARLESAEGPEHIERLGELDRLVTAVDTAMHNQTAHDQLFTGLESTRVQVLQALEATQPVLEQARVHLQRESRQLQNTQTSEGRPFEGYRNGMENLVRAVDRETRWRYKPVGPIGRHVKLSNMDWQLQIERTFGGVLDGFICTNKDDQMLLSQIMKKMNCDPNIYIGNPAPLDTTGKEPREGIDTLLRILHIDNTLVRNQLIINQNIDQFAVVKSRAEAQQIMYQDRERNVKVAMALGGRPGSGIRFERSRMGEEKSSPVAPWDRTPRMKTDRDQQIRVERQRVDTAKIAVDDAENRTRELKRAAEVATQAVNAFRKQQKTNKIRVQEAQSEVERQQNDIEANKPEDGRLQALETQLEEAQSTLEQNRGSYQDFVVAKDALNDNAHVLKQRLDEAQLELDEGKARIVKAEKRVTQMATARHEALLQKNDAINNLALAKGALTRTTARRDAQREKLADFNGQAEAVCQRVAVEPGITGQQLDDRIERFLAELNQREREAGGTREELALAWKRAHQEYREAQDQIAEMKKVEKTLTRTLASRHKRWRLFRKYITYRARTMFQYLLSERQFRGRVLVDHSNKLLDIKVEPDLARVSDAGRETRTLSGGEKSFSTICLLLSIWDAMGSPIRCLDEFDVFMDSVNRATSMTMMIQAARRAVGRQFILITPQAMNNVTTGDDVRIYRMSDPERGQQTLPF